jgi:hypothetical protein
MAKRILGLAAVLILLASYPKVEAQVGVNSPHTTISFSSSGDNTVLSTCTSVTNVYKYFIVNSDASTATNITVKAGSTAVTGAFRLASGGSAFFGQDSQNPWARVTAGGNFVINSSAAVQISGEIWYACTTS